MDTTMPEDPTPLAQRLVDAAAEAIGGTICEHMADQGQVSCNQCDGRAAAGAALAKLAEEWDAERRNISLPADARTLAAITISVNKLRRLAADIRESPCP
jgi:hypothetical protein